MSYRTKLPMSDRYPFLAALVESIKPVITPAILHPAKREQGVSFNRREQMRRNRAKYGKRQIRIDVYEYGFIVRRDWHMPITERRLKKGAESKSLSTLESYQHALFTSGYRLLSASPTELIYQYEGQMH